MKTRQQDNLEDRLLELASELVTERVFEEALKRLFTKPAGAWLNWSDLQVQVDRFSVEVVELEERAGSPLLVAWIDNPQSVYGDGYVTVHCLVEAIGWWTTAIYNKRRLLKSKVVNGSGPHHT